MRGLALTSASTDDRQLMPLASAAASGRPLHRGWLHMDSKLRGGATHARHAHARAATARSSLEDPSAPSLIRARAGLLSGVSLRIMPRHGPAGKGRPLSSCCLCVVQSRGWQAGHWHQAGLKTLRDTLTEVAGSMQGPWCGSGRLFWREAGAWHLPAAAGGRSVSLSGQESPGICCAVCRAAASTAPHLLCTCGCGGGRRSAITLILFWAGAGRAQQGLLRRGWGWNTGAEGSRSCCSCFWLLAQSMCAAAVLHLLRDEKRRSFFRQTILEDRGGSHRAGFLRRGWGSNAGAGGSHPRCSCFSLLVWAICAVCTC